MKQTINQLPEKLRTLPIEIQKEFVELKNEEMLSLRASRKSFTVIKIGDKIYVLFDKKERKEDEKQTMKYVCGKHRCGKCGNFCGEDGVLCPKVARKEKRAEEFPFITMAVERVNSEDDYFVVAKCKRFKHVKDRQTENVGICSETDEKFEQRAMSARQEIEEQRRKRLEGQQYYNFGYKPW